MSKSVARKNADARASGVVDPRGDVVSLYARDGARKYLNGEERRRALVQIEALAPDRPCSP